MKKADAHLMLGWTSLIIMMTGVLVSGSVLFARYVPVFLKIDLDQKIDHTGMLLAVLLAILAAIIFLVYLAAILWMVAMKPFLPREAVYTIMTAGITTRFDHWLFNRLYPPRTGGRT